jgi:aminoglycoside phosphotransferase (APT) family kinase protein
VLVHGDVGFHNILMEGAMIRAVLDWEFAHPGEAAEDLSYCRPFVEALGPWGEFLAAYAAAGGTPPSDGRLAYYAVWRGVRNATCCALGASHVRQGRTHSLRIAHAGFVLIDRFSEDVGRQLDVARGPTAAREIRRRGVSAS